jgi:hypothetical protein
VTTFADLERDVDRVALADLKAQAESSLIRARGRRRAAARRRAWRLRAGIAGVCLGVPAGIELVRFLTG